MLCPKCQSENPDKAKFCNECAAPLKDKKTKSYQDGLHFKGERKHATVLFSDLSGYTTMTEKMDPEDVKNLMEDIFEKAGKIVEKYQGTVDSFFGDEILVLFGVPKVHEDDPIRAIHTAIEIHKLVEELSPEFERRNLGRLSMHSGINSGLVITGDKYIGKGRQGLAGDTINLANRLTGLAKPGEIIVGSDTYKIAEPHFSFEQRDPVFVKGKKDSVQTYQVIDTIKKSIRTKHLQGLRAELIGRDKELLKFNQIVNELKKSKGSVLCLYGFAGTGKSRLVEEFKSITNVKWIEGYSYPYTKNTPYFPLLTLFNGVFRIKEEDTQEKIKIKIEKGIKSLIIENHVIIPYIGTLYSLSYPEIDDDNPELWKSNLFDAVIEILSALAKQQPTIICIEDLHWADPSFLELIHHIQLKTNLPIFFLYISRPIVKIFSENQKDQLGKIYQEIKIEDLSRSDSKVMVKSLLKSADIPLDLKEFIETKTQGNPFYLEEMINSLIESDVLTKENDAWVLQRKITSSDVSSSIHGVISARVDRLESESKRILQEASVIGRSFYYEVIDKITEIEKDISKRLETLEGFDLIKSGQSKIDLEYMFKHALTQEVVYNGLLKAERKVIHEKIGKVIEQIFHDRLPEFYESLAHHFSKGNSKLRAIKYLTKSGDKCLERFAVNEANEYFQKAYYIFQELSGEASDHQDLLIGMLNQWAYCFYYLGNFKDLMELYNTHASDFATLNDDVKIGMHNTWYGIAYFCMGKVKKSYELLKKALKLGEKCNNQKVIGYACTWLSWVCGSLLKYDEGIAAGKRAHKIAESFPSDQFLFFKSLSGMCWIYTWQGRMDELYNGAIELMEYGKRTANKRSTVMGHWMMSSFYFYTGDMASTIKYSNYSISNADDPFYAIFSRVYLGLSCIEEQKIADAKEHIGVVIELNEKNNVGIVACLPKVQAGMIEIIEGRMEQGFNMIHNVAKSAEEAGMYTYLPIIEFILGRIYLNIAQGKGPKTLPIILKNIRFILKNVPFAAKKAERHFHNAINMSSKFEMEGVLASVCFELGLLKKMKKRNNQAIKYLNKAIEIFEKIGAFTYLKQAKKELNDLK